MLLPLWHWPFKPHLLGWWVAAGEGVGLTLFQRWVPLQRYHNSE